MRSLLKERRETKRTSRRKLNKKKSGTCIAMEIRSEINKKKNNNEIMKKKGP